MSKKRSNFEINLDNVGAFTLEQLQVMYEAIAESLAEVNAKVEDVKDRMKSGDESINMGWFRRLKGARRAKGYQHQLLARQLKKKKREERERTVEAEYAAFKRVIKRRVSPEEYREILLEKDIEVDTPLEESFDEIDFEDNIKELDDD